MLRHLTQQKVYDSTFIIYYHAHAIRDNQWSYANYKKKKKQKKTKNQRL